MKRRELIGCGVVELEVYKDFAITQRLLRAARHRVFNACRSLRATYAELGGRCDEIYNLATQIYDRTFHEGAKTMSQLVKALQRKNIDDAVACTQRLNSYNRTCMRIVQIYLQPFITHPEVKFDANDNPVSERFTFPPPDISAFYNGLVEAKNSL